MAVKLHFLPADSGDSFFLELSTDQKKYTILIDGGYKKLYKQELKKLIEESYKIENQDNYIVLTHIDEDHINGILALLQKSKGISAKIKGVFFNTFSSLNQMTPAAEDAPPRVLMPSENQTLTGVKAGDDLEKLLKKLNVPIITNVISPKTFELGDVKINILAPRSTTMERYKSWFEEQEDRKQTGVPLNDYSTHIDDFPLTRYNEDNSPTNGSSIAMLLTFDGKRLLFLGDSYGSDVLASLRELGYSKENRFCVDVVKISHHGSRQNTSFKLLECLECKRFLISTNGSANAHPNKETLARIISSQECPTLYFNYDIYQNIFSECELKDPRFSVAVEREITL